MADLKIACHYFKHFLESRGSSKGFEIKEGIDIQFFFPCEKEIFPWNVDIRIMTVTEFHSDTRKIQSLKVFCIL